MEFFKHMAKIKVSQKQFGPQSIIFNVNLHIHSHLERSREDRERERTRKKENDSVWLKHEKIPIFGRVVLTIQCYYPNWNEVREQERHFNVCMFECFFHAHFAGHSIHIYVSDILCILNYNFDFFACAFSFILIPLSSMNFREWISSVQNQQIDETNAFHSVFG